MYEENLEFPEGFCWGVSTAAYQIEGAAAKDGKGKSIWDVFANVPGHIADARTGDVACDHYHRYREDVSLMKALNVKNYRMSIAWSRVFPEGGGKLNGLGLDFYDRLIDNLLENGVVPWVTLFHWDLPDALQKKGGWANRETIDRFLEYADTVSRYFGDRVKDWMTFNEPWVYSFCGHLYGVHAPGIKDLPTALAVAHNILVAHGKSVPVIRKNVSEAKVGIVNNLAWIEAATDADVDIAAARRWDLAFNKWFMDPIVGRPYPSEIVALYGDKMPKIESGDMEAMAVKTDFIGINYYTRRLVAHDPSNAHIKAKQVYRPCLARADFEEWEVNPESLYLLLRDLKKNYGNIPVYVIYNE